MSEVPVRAGETVTLKVATAFQKKVTVHFEAKVFEKVEDASGGPLRSFAETREWDENLVAKPAPKGETGSLIPWTATTFAPGTTSTDTRPAEVRATVYGASATGEAVSSTPADQLVVAHGMIDARLRVEAAAQPANVSLATVASSNLVDFGDPIARDDGPGWGRWNGTRRDGIALQGELRFVEAGTTPKLFGVWIPAGLAARASDAIDFVVLFHPFVKAESFPGGEKAYPYHPRYLQTIMSYVVTGYWSAPQVQLAKRAVAFVFPMGSSTSQMGDFTKHDVLLATLEQLCVHLGRFCGFRNQPHRKVGRVALACYSFGATHVHAVLDSALRGGSFAGTLFEKHWRETWLCDPVPDQPRRTDFASKLVKWWSKGAEGRCLRFYNQPNLGASFWPTLTAGLGDPVPNLVYGSKEIHVPADPAAGTGGATVLETTASFWDSMLVDTKKKPIRSPEYFTLHPWFPRLFQYHALKNSLFASL